jgi:beta-N-acetylglucosaminidase
MIHKREKQSKTKSKRAKAINQSIKDSKRSIKFLRLKIQLEQNRPRLKTVLANKGRDE